MNERSSENTTNESAQRAEGPGQERQKPALHRSQEPLPKHGGEMRIGKPTKAFMLRHMKKTANGCWEWTRSKDRKGYGQVGVNYKHIYAHRLAYMLWIGEIPEGMCVCHHCDNPPCFNPNHLFIGTRKDNARDAAQKGRTFIPGAFCEQHPMAKLTNEQVQEIRRLFIPLKVTRKMLSEKFGVSVHTIASIVNNVHWKKLDPTQTKGKL